MSKSDIKAIEHYEEGYDLGYDVGFNEAVRMVVLKLRAKAGAYTKMSKQLNPKNSIHTIIGLRAKSSFCKDLAREIERMKI